LAGRWRSVCAPLARAAAAGVESLARLRKSTRRPALTRYEVEFGGRDLHYSNRKICLELGFSSQILPDEGLARTIAWLKSLDLAMIKAK
jgi:nucleoside-diphosphate-sugar epimerase